MTPPTLTGPTEGRTVAVVGDIYRFLAVGSQTNGRYAVWEALVLPGGGPPPHVHTREEEGFLVLDGEVVVTVNGVRTVARAGAYAAVPVGTPHSFKNESVRPARMVITVAPAGVEDMFFEIGTPVEPGTTTAPPPTEADIEKLIAAAPRYGIELLPPPH